MRQLRDQGVPDDDARRITWQNASELFRHPLGLPAAEPAAVTLGVVHAELPHAVLLVVRFAPDIATGGLPRSYRVDVVDEHRHAAVHRSEARAATACRAHRRRVQPDRAFGSAHLAVHLPSARSTPPDSKPNVTKSRAPCMSSYTRMGITLWNFVIGA